MLIVSWLTPTTTLKQYGQTYNAAKRDFFVLHGAAYNIFSCYLKDLTPVTYRNTLHLRWPNAAILVFRLAWNISVAFPTQKAKSVMNGKKYELKYELNYVCITSTSFHGVQSVPVIHQWLRWTEIGFVSGYRPINTVYIIFCEMQQK